MLIEIGHVEAIYSTLRPSPEKSGYRNVWSAAELQAENEDDSWSALMYSAFRESKTPGHDGHPLALAPINWTVSKDHFRNQVPKALGSTFCHLCCRQQT